MILSARETKKLVHSLARGGMVVMPTDTIYGIMGSALSPKAVAKIYRLRHRDMKKPMITLIAEPDDVRQFGVHMTPKLKVVFQKFWPGKVSIIMSMAKNKAILAKFKYLHRGSKTLAFRCPKALWLRKLLQETGPLIAPSANLRGMPPAHTVAEAKKYFGKNVDIYIDGGKRAGRPSTLLKIVPRGNIIVIRR